MVNIIRFISIVCFGILIAAFVTVLSKSAVASKFTGITSDTANAPAAVVFKDSAQFFFPIQNTYRQWQWNTSRMGFREYHWLVRLTVNEDGFYFGYLKTVPEGANRASGTFHQLIADGTVGIWKSDLMNPIWDVLWRRMLGVQITENGLLVCVKDLFLAELIAAQGHDSVTLMYGDHPETDAQLEIPLVYVSDPAELKARKIEGILTSDEYAIYQTVIRRPTQKRKDVRIVLNPTIAIPDTLIDRVFGHTRVHLTMFETSEVDSVFHEWTSAVDLQDLNQLGYCVVNADTFYAGRKKRREFDLQTPYIRVSRIGFNNSKNLAIVYCTYSCGGMLCGEGNLLVLKRRPHGWIIVRRVHVWIS